MSVLLPVLAVLAAAGAGGLAFLARVLRRDKGTLWRPGDKPPEVPPDAAIRRVRHGRPR